MRSSRPTALPIARPRSAANHRPPNRDNSRQPSTPGVGCFELVDRPATSSQGGCVIDIGPQYERDDEFTRRMRWHQSWYRARVLRVPHGTGPTPSSRTLYGNMLTGDAASCGLNFLTTDIFELARQRIAAGTGAVDEFRLLRNLLSSQPMAFNLFGTLALNLDVATQMVRALWGAHVKRVTDVRFEWAPRPAGEYLDDRTAFDVFIEYDGALGQPGFIGIEVKLTEPFSQRRYDKPTYRRWMTPDSPWRVE